MLKLEDFEKPACLMEQNGVLKYMTGELKQFRSLFDLERLQDEHANDIVFVTPFCAARDNGMVVQGDEDMMVIVVQNSQKVTPHDIERLTKNTEIIFSEEIEPDIDDTLFVEQVKQIQQEEIAEGNACQVVFSRKFQGRLADQSPLIPLTLFKRLLKQHGQYLTFLFTDGAGHYFVGASPERQLEIHDELVIKNPIAGTMPKTTKAAFIQQLDDFVHDQKEINELSQILDEELKIMARICPRGGKISGPFLRESGAVIHTEYHLTGHSRKSAVTALRLSLHAPTLVGSPLESAFRIIAKREQSSRRYYGGEIGVIQKNGDMYSAIMIRTAEIFADGRIAIQAGAGVVRDSDPMKEARETQAKAAGLMLALSGKQSATGKFLTSSLLKAVNQTLKQRNDTFSSFHFEDQIEHVGGEHKQDQKITIINNEDNFANILSHLTLHLGFRTEVVDTHDYTYESDDSDIVIIGPGPGDINDSANERIRQLQKITSDLVSGTKPVLGVCLGIQAIAKDLGIPVRKQKVPTQGVQVEIELFGKREKVGMYNSFSPLNEHVPESLQISADEKGRIMALRRKNLYGIQFHAESAMTQNGYRIITEILSELSDEKGGVA